jgi:hypothetical protein
MKSGHIPVHQEDLRVFLIKKESPCGVEGWGHISTLRGKREDLTGLLSEGSLQTRRPLSRSTGSTRVCEQACFL